MDDPSLKLQLVLNCLLVIIYFRAFLDWLVYMFCTITIMPRIVKCVAEVVSWNVPTGKLAILVDDSPPAYDDMFAGEVKDGEDDLSLPSYQVVCERR